MTLKPLVHANDYRGSMKYPDGPGAVVVSSSSYEIYVWFVDTHERNTLYINMSNLKDAWIDGTRRQKIDHTCRIRRLK